MQENINYTPPVYPTDKPTTAKPKKTIPTFIGIAIVVVVAVVLFGGVFAWQYSLNLKADGQSQKPIACTEEAKICPDGSAVGRTGPNCEFVQCPDLTAGWQTYTNNQYGFEFKYPEINKNYIRSQQWPPIVTINQDISNYSCPTLPQRTKFSNGYGEQKEIIINNNKYCLKITSEGAAGTIYESYSFITIKDNKFLTFTFNLGFPNCENYSDLQIKTNCRNEQSDFNSQFITLINNIFSSFKFIMPDQTAGWKTYINNDWGIEFKYPAIFGNPKVDGSINRLFFNGDKGSMSFLEKTTLDDIKKCEEQCIEDQKSKDFVMCAPCLSTESWRKEKNFIENSNVGKVACLGYKCENCEIVKMGDIKMLVEHDCFNPGGLVDAKHFFENNTLFSFLPLYQKYMGDILGKYGIDEKTVLSTFKFTK